MVFDTELYDAEPLLLCLKFFSRFRNLKHTQVKIEP